MLTALALLIVLAFAGFVWRAARNSTPAATPGVQVGQRSDARGDFADTYRLDDGPGREQTEDTGGGPLPIKPK